MFTDLTAGDILQQGGGLDGGRAGHHVAAHHDVRRCHSLAALQAGDEVRERGVLRLHHLVGQALQKRVKVIRRGRIGQDIVQLRSQVTLTNLGCNLLSRSQDDQSHSSPSSSRALIVIDHLCWLNGKSILQKPGRQGHRPRRLPSFPAVLSVCQTNNHLLLSSNIELSNHLSR